MLTLPVLLSAAALTAHPARVPSESPKAPLSIWVGATLETIGLAVGGLVLASSTDSSVQQGGWMIASAGFVVAPVAAHVVSGEWARGLLFGAAPAGCFVGSAVTLTQSDAVEHSSLQRQRVMWGFFAGGLASSVVGLVDAALVDTRHVRVAPTLSSHSAGFTLEGQF